MSTIVKIGALQVHAGAHLVSWNGEIIQLTEAERRLLKVILVQGSATWEELKKALHPNADVSDNLLNVSLSHLRPKLKKATVAYEIKAIRGWGVILVDHDSGLPLRRRPPSNRIANSRHPTARKSVVAH